MQLRFWLAAAVLSLTVISVGRAEAPARKPVRFVSEEAHQSYQLRLRETKNDTLAKLADGDIIFYTTKEMMPIYQDWDRYYVGIGGIGTNPSGVSPGNANREFPWATTAGLETAANSLSAKFLVLPEDGSPIAYWRQRLPGVAENYDAYIWEYPVGTVFGEILMLHNGKHWYTFEVRTRTKKSAGFALGWTANVFRPFRTPDEIVSRVKELRPEWDKDPTTAAFVSHLENPARGYTSRLVDNNHRKVVFDRQAVIDKLPGLPHDLVAELLTTTPFQSTLGTEWISHGTLAGFAPDTDANFHVVPKNNRLAFMKADTQSCMTCHDTVLHQADEFDGPREWYGRVRGSDAIFSFHIFDPSRVPYSGYTTAVSLRRELVDSGRLVHKPEKRGTNLHPTVRARRENYSY
jgi:hypothetical protein